MRGKEEIVKQAAKYGRITPAYAGKRRSFNHLRRKRQDHPRLCGEKDRCVSDAEIFEGSPPPMRGKVSAVLTHANGLRITPAYAGKSFDVDSAAVLAGDHPRLCGEKLCWSLVCLGQAGSPPPMRGKVPMWLFFCTVTRITPAYAGKR